MGVMFFNLRRKSIYKTSAFIDFTNYVSRSEAVDKSVTDINSVDNMFDYYSRKNASDTIGFDFLGDKSKEDCLNEFMKYRPYEIYTGVISLKEFDAKCIGINSKSDWVNLTNKFIKKSLEQLNIRRTDLVWGGFYHTNTDNPHIHFYIYSKTKKNLNLLPKKKIMRLRSTLANILINNLELFQEKDQLKNEQKSLIKGYMEKVEMDNLIKQNIVKRMMNFNLSFEDKSIASAIIDASKLMKSTGKLTMNYLEKSNPSAYQRMMVVVDSLVDKNEDKFNEYKNVLSRISDDYKIIYGKNNKVKNYESTQMKNFKHQIGNMILKEIKKSGIIQSNYKDYTNRIYYNNYFASKASYELKISVSHFLDRALSVALHFKLKEIDVRLIGKGKENVEEKNQ